MKKYIYVVAAVLALTACGKKEEAPVMKEAVVEETDAQGNTTTNADEVAAISATGLDSKAEILRKHANLLPVPPEKITISCKDSQGQYIISYDNYHAQIPVDIACEVQTDNYVLKMTREPDSRTGNLYSVTLYNDDFMKVFGANSDILNPFLMLKVMERAERNRLQYKGIFLDDKRIKYVSDDLKFLLNSPVKLGKAVDTEVARNSEPTPAKEVSTPVVKVEASAPSSVKAPVVNVNKSISAN